MTRGYIAQHEARLSALEQGNRPRLRTAGE
jgi:hypothetical protein